jgi:hypothetical protein
MAGEPLLRSRRLASLEYATAACIIIIIIIISIYIFQSISTGLASVEEVG